MPINLKKEEEANGLHLKKNVSYKDIEKVFYQHRNQDLQDREDEYESEGYHFGDILAGKYQFGDITRGLLDFDADILSSVYNAGSDLVTSGFNTTSSLVGDILTGDFESAGNTLADVGTSLGKGFLGTIEGSTDWLLYRLADLSEMTGADSLLGINPDEMRKTADFNSTGAWFGTNENPNDNPFGSWTEGIREKSSLGDLERSVFEGIGNVAGLAGTGYLTGGSTLSSVAGSYTSAYGNARSEAIRNGASERDANRVGIINGVAEALSEQFFDAMPGMKVEGWGSKLTGKLSDKVTKYFGSTAGKIALKTFDALGEGTEEILSNALVAVGNDLMHYYDSNFTYGMDKQSGNVFEDAFNAFTDSDSWSAFFSASMTSALLNVGKAAINKNTQNKIINAYAKDNNMSFKDAKYILTGQMESAKQELQRDNTEYDSKVELEDMAKNRILNYMQNYTGNNIEAQIEERIKEQEKELGTTFTKEQRENMKTELRSMYEDRINSQNRYQEFTLEKEPTDEREKGLYESFKQNNRNNTKETHDIYKFIKTLQDNNPTSKYRLTSNEELAKMGELERVEQDGKVKYLKDGKEVAINGFKKGDTIYINADAVNPYQSTIGHEIGEAIKASDKQAYDDLKKLVKQVYGEGNLDDYKQIYGENLTDNVEDEYVNDKLGEMFKDNKLIDRIGDNRNLLQKLIDEVKRLVNYVTSKGEKKQLLKLQKSLQDKYIELYKEADFNKGSENTSFSLQEGLEKQGEKILEQANADYEAARQNILDYLEENNIDNPTKQDMMDAFGWYDEYDASQDMSELQRAERIYSEAADDILKEMQQPKYSLSQDSQGRELTKEQQEYFKDSKVRDEEGRLIPMFHGTPTGTTTEFRPGTYFTSNKQYADTYQNPSASSISSADRKVINNPRTYQVYLDIKNPFDISNPDIRDIFINEYVKGGYALGINPYLSDAEYNKIQTIDWTEGENLQEFLEEEHPEFDGLVLNEGGIPLGNGEVLDRGTSYVVMSPEQVKNIDNTNPTSSPDIRFSLSPTGEMVDNTTGEKVTFDAQEVQTQLPTNKTLMAIHNLNEDKLNGVLDLGGFPVPSIAITNPKLVNHNQFGNISVIFDKNTIDPSNKYNEVYDRDVWSPTFPQVDYEINSDNIDNIATNLGIEDWKLSDYAEDSSKPEYLIDKLVRDEDVINKYVEENNINYETAYKESNLKWYNKPENIKKFIIDNQLSLEKIMNDKELRNKYYNELRNEFSKLETEKEEINKQIDYIEHMIEDKETSRLQTLSNNLNSLVSGNNMIVDEWQTNKNKKDAAITNGIEDYLKEQTKDIFGEKGIRNDKEYLTPSGNRRSFWQLHDEYNLENIVDALTKGDTTGTQNWFAGYGQIQANMANQFNSIEEIKQNENRLVDLSNNNEQLEEARANIENDIDEIVARNDTDMSIVSELLADFARGKLTKDNFRKLTKNTYQTTQNVSDELLEKTINDLKALKDLPTDYFEAKPQRAVELNEIGAVVIPSNVSEELKQRLRDNNIDFTEYNPEIEGDRSAKINEYQQYMFSLGKQDQNQQSGFEETEQINDYSDYIESLNLPATDRFGILTKEDYTNKKKELYEQYVDRAANKIEEQVKEAAKRNLELKKQDISALKEITDKYSNMSREDIYSSNAKEELRNFVKEHSHQEYEEQIINDEIRNLQKDIRSREFIISDDFKGEFPDGLTRFKKNNPGIHIKFGQKGNIDTQLQELSQLYPGQINADVSYGDIPYVLADIMKKEYKTANLQEFSLNEDEIDNITNKMFFGLTNNALSDSDIDKFVTSIQDKIRNKYARQMAIKEYRQLARDVIGDISQIKDKKRGLLYQINTMKRNLRDIMTPEQATKMYDIYFKPISIHNAQIETDINEYNDRISKYNLNNEESTYTQMLGELKYNPKTSLSNDQVDEYLQKHKNKIDTKKVNSAIEEFRTIYDELIGRINEALEANGYKPIDYRTGYFPHFIEDKADNMLGKFAEKLGFQFKKGQLPTDIQGITDEFLPGKAWTAFSQRRTGDATDYNALKGIDNYLRGAMDVIYHTQDIQRLRALEAEIRYQYSDKGVQQKLDEIYDNQDLSSEEKYAQAALVTDNVKNNPLGNFATELRNYTNNLANKKAIGDRGMEQTLGRDMYSIMNNISSRVSANMVGANISSAITNFIPITQAWSQVSTKNMLRGIYDTIKSNIRDDGFADNSIYLTNRTKQAEKLFKTKLQKATDFLSKPFEAIDSFTSNTIVRAKYYENLDKGMNEVDAINNADEFAKDVMAGRSKGDSPTMFNKKNPLAKLFTAFQLEVNNQYGYMFKDIKVDIGKEAKEKIALAFLKMFLGAWLYNQISEKVTGRKAAFSPIDMAIDEAKIITNNNMDLATKVQNLTKDVAEEMPFLGGVLGGGRLPIQGAIPYNDPLSMVLETGQNLGALLDDEKRDKAINSLKKEWLKPVYYIALPVAGGQLKKTNEGLAMYNHELPGSYTDSGNLRFEADTSPLGILQSAIFGQYASANAREYFNEGYSPLTEKQVNEAMDANLPINEYRQIKKGITKATNEAKNEGESQSEAKVDYIYNLPISDDQKNVLVNNALNRKNDIDLTNYGEYSSLEEFDYSNKNPEKYETITQITDYNTFQTYKDEISDIKSQYSNTNDRKQAVFDYINSLPINKYQKMMLQKMGGGYSIKEYENQMFDYINNLDISKQEKENIHKELFG